MTHAQFIKKYYKTNSTYKGISYRINVIEEGTYELVINGNKFDEEAEGYFFEHNIREAIRVAKMLIDENRYWHEKNASEELAYAEFWRKKEKV